MRLLGRLVMTSLMASSAVLSALEPRSTGAQIHQPDTYASADVDANGGLRITTSSGLVVVVRKQGEQSSFRRVTLSPDRSAVAAQAEYPSCCTSYGLPLELVVYSQGTVHRFKGIGLPIFRWHFADGGDRIAYGQEPVHFGCEIHYELRDIESERLIDSADVPQSCGQRPDPPETAVPKWVDALNEAHGSLR